MVRLARLLCLSVAVGVAIWLLPASIHIVDWTADGPARVALLPPLWTLWIALAIALAAAVVWRGAGLAPLAFLGLLAVPYLPWIPDRAPALLALAGPLRWAIVALAIAGSAAALWPQRLSAVTTAWSGRKTIFVLSLALYLCAGHRSADGVGPDGDEPHYLVITQSLLRDGDIAIENNHQRGDYHEYYARDLRPDFLRRGLHDVIYSIHAPGLPALLVPAFAIDGYWGAVVMLCLLAALTAMAVTDLATLIAGPAAALATWAAVCLTIPFVPHAWLIFPEMPAALLMAWAALWLYAPLPANVRRWVWRGAALAMLPWLHTKFVILLVAMTGALALRLWRQPKAMAALVVPVAISVAAWLWSFHVLYGSFDPQVPYGDFPAAFVLVANIPRGLFGLLFDQKFGLLPYAPIYLIAIAGAWTMLRRSELRWFALALIATIGVFVASSARMAMWWGGASAPARFLVPILPLVAPMIAIGWRQARTVGRATAAVLLALSLFLAVDGIAWPRRFLLFSPPHGEARMIEALQGPAPLTAMLPTFTDGSIAHELVVLAPWTIAGALALLAGVQVKRKTGAGAMSVVYAEVIVFVLVSAVAAGRPSTVGRRAAAARGRVELIAAYDGRSQRAFGYSRGWLDERGVLDLAAQRGSLAAGESADDEPVAGPFPLPPGRYAARFLFAKASPEPGEIFVALRDRQIIARRRGSFDGVATLPFEVPVDATVWAGITRGPLARTTTQVQVVVESVVPRSERPDVQVRALEPIADYPGAFIVYTGSETYPENGSFWSRGTDAGEVLVAPNGASTLTLTLHVGPAAGIVRLIVDGKDRSVTLARDQTQQIDIALPPGARLVPVLVQAPGQFRPADQEPGSTDQRWLGVQVRVGLR